MRARRAKVAGMRAFVLLLLLFGSGCFTFRLDDPALAVTIRVTGLRQDERVDLRDRVCALDGVTDCKLVDNAAAAAKTKGKKEQAAPVAPSKEALLSFTYRGSLGNLRYRISQLPHPGLEALKADVELGYRGFDNKAPKIEIDPSNREPIADKSVRIAVHIPDVDLATVEIGDHNAERSGENHVATINDLKEGENKIVVKATDQAGNAREETILVLVDTTPPEVQVAVEILAYDKALVRGKVSSDAVTITIDGREAKPDLFGSFQREVAVDPDKSLVEVVVTDALGNERRIKRSAKVASPMGDQSK